MKTLLPNKNLHTIIGELLDHPDFLLLKQNPDAFSQDIAGIDSPVWIPDTIQAVILLKHVISSKGSVLLIGDRDVDGVTSTSLLANFLEKELVQKGGKMEVIVSDDGDDYGLTGNVFDKAKMSSADIMILLDMGSSNGPEINTLCKTKKVIVLDHHQLHDRTPDPNDCAFVNPMRYKDNERLMNKGKISTSGIVFKTLLAYAFSFTNEWNIVYKIQDPQAEIYHFFKLGLYLGSNSIDIEKNSCHLDTSTSKIIELSLANLSTSNNLHLSKSEWSRVFKFPQKAGSLLIAGAIRSRVNLQNFVIETSKLASLGLIADMMPLIGENRSIVKTGFSRCGNYQKKDESSDLNIGLSGLFRKLNLPVGKLYSKDAGWTIGPVLNAAGRMGNTNLALKLLTAKDTKTANKLSEEIVSLNIKRKERTRANEIIVENFFKSNPDELKKSVIICYHPELQKGVSGIVATRLTEKYQKPAIYINPENQSMAKGSARTWDGINVLHLIDQCSDLMEQFGGHPEAAGFSIRIDMIEKFKQRIHQSSMSDFFQIEKNKPVNYHIDVPLNLVGPELFLEIDNMEPFGAQNPEPKILLRNVFPENIKSLSHGLHIKFSCKNISRSVDFILWNKAQDFLARLGKSGSIDIIGILEKNFFAGRTRLQFRIVSYETGAGF